MKYKLERQYIVSLFPEYFQNKLLPNFWEITGNSTVDDVHTFCHQVHMAAMCVPNQNHRHDKMKQDFKISRNLKKFVRRDQLSVPNRHSCTAT